MSEAKSRMERGLAMRAIILGSALLFSLPLFAQESNDVLVMKNGDRFTCAPVEFVVLRKLGRPPSVTLPGSDYGTSSGLSWTFGNR
jgi:hypothetical protein